jgi:hypothetical protein
VFGNQILKCLVICFLKLLTPFIWGGGGGCNFIIYYIFFRIFSVSDAPKGGIQVLFRHQKNWSLPLDLAYPECLSVRSLAFLPYLMKGLFLHIKKKKVVNICPPNNLVIGVGCKIWNKNEHQGSSCPCLLMGFLVFTFKNIVHIWSHFGNGCKV